MSLLSWGEKVIITFLSDDSIAVTSKCAFPGQCLDWGKNKANIKKFIAELKNHKPRKSPGPPPQFSSEMSPGKRIFRILSGVELAVVCLSLLVCADVLRRTIEQTVVRPCGRRFTSISTIESVTVTASQEWRREDRSFLPLPGAYWVIVVLSVNMFLGGIIRARKGWKKAGTLVSHFAILFLLVAECAVSSVYQGRRADAGSPGRAVRLRAEALQARPRGLFNTMKPGAREEPVDRSVRAHQDLWGRKRSSTCDVSFEKFDFTLAELITYLPGTPKLALDSPDQPGSRMVSRRGGRVLSSTEAEKNVQQPRKANTPGLLRHGKGDKIRRQPIQRLVLWGGNPYPVSFSHEGQRYGVTYLMEVWPMPFMVELHKTYWGGPSWARGMARWFQSNITKIDGTQREEYDRDE